MAIRFVKRKAQPFDAGFPIYQHILQELVAVKKDPSYGSTMEWRDVEVVDEEQRARDSEEIANE